MYKFDCSLAIHFPLIPFLPPMATATKHFTAVVFLAIIFLPAAHSTSASSCGYSSVFSFGDSLADTGNRAYAPDRTPSFCNKPPYGMTFFGHPAGRCSDGRLMLDFIAEATGLPLLPPYLRGSGGRADFRKGVNFAVAGATALDSSFFQEEGIETLTSNSLGVQVEWFKSLLPLLCASGGTCDTLMGTSLFIVGEIGGNDLNYPFMAGKSLQEIEPYVPLIISSISSAIQEIVKLGGRNFVVPGNFPIGCSAAYLSSFSKSKKEDYDSIGCIVWLNKFIQSYNQQLQDELSRLRQIHPYSNIIYADYYSSAMRIYQDPSKYGFSNAFASCCSGRGSRRGLRISGSKCGDPGTTVCSNPSEYVNWDGMHFTEAAYRVIASGLLDGTFAYPTTSGFCPSVRGEDSLSAQ